MNKYLNDLNDIENPHLIAIFKENEDLNEIFNIIDDELKEIDAKTVDTYENKDLKKIKKKIRSRLIDKNNYINIYTDTPIRNEVFFKVILEKKNKNDNIAFKLTFIIDNINKKIKCSTLIIENKNLNFDYFNRELLLQHDTTKIVLSTKTKEIMYELTINHHSKDSFVFIEKETNITKGTTRRIDHSFYFNVLSDYVLKGKEVEKIREAVELCDLTEDGNKNMIEDIINDMKESGFIFDKVSDILSNFVPKNTLVKKRSFFNKIFSSN